MLLFKGGARLRASVGTIYPTIRAPSRLLLLLYLSLFDDLAVVVVAAAVWAYSTQPLPLSCTVHGSTAPHDMPRHWRERRITTVVLGSATLT